MSLLNVFNIQLSTWSDLVFRFQGWFSQLFDTPLFKIRTEPGLNQELTAGLNQMTCADLL